MYSAQARTNSNRSETPITCTWHGSRMNEFSKRSSCSYGMVLRAHKPIPGPPKYPKPWPPSQTKGSKGHYFGYSRGPGMWYGFSNSMTEPVPELDGSVAEFPIRYSTPGLRGSLCKCEVSVIDMLTRPENKPKHQPHLVLPQCRFYLRSPKPETLL